MWMDLSQPTNSHKALFLPTAVWPHALFFRKVASANEKGKENIEYFFALSGKTAEAAIIIFVNIFFFYPTNENKTALSTC
jgi:hypothetical protein